MTTAAAPALISVAWLGEACLAHPNAMIAADSPAVVIIPPLFDESNRMRRTLVRTMRALGAAGVPALLPDLPGQNDSLVPTEAVTLADWRAGLAERVAALPRPVVIASLRGGALIDDAVVGAANVIGWWRLAPITGASILRNMLRTAVASAREDGGTVTLEQLRDMARRAPLNLGGNRLSPAMVDQLEAATPAPLDHCGTRMLQPGDADHTGLPGSPLWLRAEPDDDATLAAAIAEDIADWSRQCGAR